MGRRRNWDAVRMVAENIASGDRSYWNLLKIPDLPTSGVPAMAELHENRFVIASSRENSVEPTEAFWPWLEGVRQTEAQQAAAQQANDALPGRQAVANTDPGNLPMLEFASPEGTVGFPHSPAPGGLKPRRQRVKRPELLGWEQMCVSVINFIRTQGGRVTLSQLRRGLNAYRHPEVFDFALRRLQKRRAIKIENEPGSRREWVTLLEVPQKYEATKLPLERRRCAPRSRGQTPWFQALMAERELED
jgi:hypothetical protein